MFWTELFSSFYLLSWHWLANWPKLYRFVKFTHRIKPSYLSTFSSTAFAGFVRKGLKSLISQVNQLYLSIHMFYKTFRSVLRNTSFLQNQVFEIPNSINYPFLSKTYLNFDEIESYMKHRFLQWLHCTWDCPQLFCVKHRCFKSFFMTRLIL